MAGKGDTQRPRLISYDEYASNYESIFRKRDHASTSPTKTTSETANDAQTPSTPEALGDSRPRAEDL